MCKSLVLGLKIAGAVAGGIFCVWNGIRAGRMSYAMSMSNDSMPDVEDIEDSDVTPGVKSTKKR